MVDKETDIHCGILMQLGARLALALGAIGLICVRTGESQFHASPRGARSLTSLLPGANRRRRRTQRAPPAPGDCWTGRWRRMTRLPAIFMRIHRR